jgi:hypothetical protein
MTATALSVIADALSYSPHGVGLPVERLRASRAMAEGVLKALERSGLVVVPEGEHILDVSLGGWILEHTASCRLKGLRNCPLNAAVTHTPKPAPGRYQAELLGNGRLLLVREPGDT